MRNFILAMIFLTTMIYAEDKIAETVEIKNIADVKIEALTKQIIELKNNNISKDALDLVLSTQKQFNIIISGILGAITVVIGWFGKLK